MLLLKNLYVCFSDWFVFMKHLKICFVAQLPDDIVWVTCAWPERLHIYNKKPVWQTEATQFEIWSSSNSIQLLFVSLFFTQFISLFYFLFSRHEKGQVLWRDIVMFLDLDLLYTPWYHSPSWFGAFSWNVFKTHEIKLYLTFTRCMYATCSHPHFLSYNQLMKSFVLN